MKRAETAHRRRVEGERLRAELAGSKPGLTQDDARKIAEDYDALGALARMGVRIKVSGGTDAHLEGHLAQAKSPASIREAFGLPPDTGNREPGGGNE